jgi:hypothetical protein
MPPSRHSSWHSTLSFNYYLFQITALRASYHACKDIIRKFESQSTQYNQNQKEVLTRSHAPSEKFGQLSHMSHVVPRTQVALYFGPRCIIPTSYYPILILHQGTLGVGSMYEVHIYETHMHRSHILYVLV